MVLDQAEALVIDEGQQEGVCVCMCKLARGEHRAEMSERDLEQDLPDNILEHARASRHPKPNS